MEIQINDTNDLIYGILYKIFLKELAQANQCEMSDNKRVEAAF